jgi:hypothetical protein
MTAQLSGASTSSIRRYASEERVAPDDVAARFHHLARINAHLAGGYNDFGIRRWYIRKRVQLDGQAPAEALSGAWDPDADGPQRALKLAEALNSSPAT